MLTTASGMQEMLDSAEWCASLAWRCLQLGIKGEYVDYLEIARFRAGQALELLDQ